MSRASVTRVVALCLTAIMVLAGCAVPQSPLPVEETEVESPSDTGQSDVYVPAQTLVSVADVVAKVKPSVVAINTETTAYDLFRRSFTQEGAGSGWVIREDGYIVTNTHVVEDAQTVTVTLDDGTTYEAEKVHADELTDIAVVKIRATGLPVVEIGDSSALRVGEPLVAIGNSLGMGISATAGIASATGVSLEASPGQTLLDLIQTDAAINPGNSGGPLLNTQGQVIGINSIKIATVGVEGMGYAISIDQALPIIEDLIHRGKVVRAWLGVGLYTVTPPLADRYSLAVDSGVVVTEVVADSPADNGGLQPGDVIVEFGGTTVATAEDLAQAIIAHDVGDRVEIVFWREETREVSYATLIEGP